jgi:hypothetical protein
MRYYRHLLDDKGDHERLNDQWDRVCYRLDIYGLVMTQTANVIILIAWLSIQA